MTTTVLLLLNLSFMGWVILKLTILQTKLEKRPMADTTTTMPPVQSTDITGSLTAFFAALAKREGVDAATITAAATQHATDQATITADQTQIAADASAKTAEDAQLATAQANQVSPATLSSIDAATNALNSGQPLPAFPGAPAPAVPTPSS